MAEEFGGSFDVDALDDAELEELVMQHIGELGSVDADLIEVHVSQGAVRITGRVGTEVEVQHVEHVVGNVLGIPSYSNDVVVDELVRAEQPEAADEAAEAIREERRLGEAGDRTDPAADHLIEDTEGDLFGTEDMHKAIARGQSYNPPAGPGREGVWSREKH